MEPIRRLDRKLAYHGVVIDLYEDTVQLSNGKKAQWDFISHGGAAAVVPVLPDGRILMVRQYRNALDRFTLEIPAGKRKSKEEPMAVCAARELEEEMGVRCENLEPLITVNTTVAFCNEEIGIFVARDLRPAQRNPDEDEEVESAVYSLEELYEMIDDQRLTDSKTVAALLAYRAKYA